MAEISSKSRLSDTKLVALPEVDYISLIWSRRPNRMDYSSDENRIRFIRRRLYAEMRPEEGKMLAIAKCTAEVLLAGLTATATAQTVPPRLIDVHEHFNGEPGVLQQMLVKLQEANGIGILLVTPKGFPEASNFIREHPDHF